MAQQQQTMEEILMAKYANTPEPILTTLKEVTYTDENLKRTPVYRMLPDTKLNDGMLASAGSLLADKIREGGKDSDLANLIFLLAMNVRRTTDVTSCLFTDLEWPNRTDMSLSAFNISWPSGSSTSGRPQATLAPRIERKTPEQLIEEADRSFRPPDTTNLNQEAAEAAISTSRNVHRRAVAAAYSLMVADEEKAEAERLSAPSRSTIRESAASPYYWPYFAAYLMKSMIKTPENVNLGEKRMRKHFVGFYPGGLSQEVSLPVSAMRNISLKLKADPKILATWLGCAAYFEERESATTQDAGMIRDLVNIQFSFNGMAGYALFREVLNVTRWKAGVAITKMRMGPTSRALDMINTILVEHESTVENNVVTNRPTLFKYARAIDPQYFLALQPSQCLSLIYICAKILNYYIAYNEISNPLKLTALQKLGKDQAEYLDIFVDTLLHEGDDNAAATDARESTC